MKQSVKRELAERGFIRQGEHVWSSRSSHLRDYDMAIFIRGGRVKENTLVLIGVNRRILIDHLSF